MSARTAFIPEEKVNTINCPLGKRNRETAVVISGRNNDRARWAVLMQGPGSQKHQSTRYTCRTVPEIEGAGEQLVLSDEG